MDQSPPEGLIIHCGLLPEPYTHLEEHIMSKTKRIVNRSILLVLGVLYGVDLVVLGSILRPMSLIWVATMIWGVSVIVSNVAALEHGIRTFKTVAGKFDCLASLGGVLLGAALTASHNVVVGVIVGACTVIVPIIRVILSGKDWVAMIRPEILRFSFGFFLLVFAILALILNLAVMNLVLAIMGWIIIALVLVWGALDIIHITTREN